MKVLELEKIWEEVYAELAKDEFKGWDPYDGLTTKVSLIHNHYYIRLLFFYFNKFSPLNFRKLFKIPKRTFTQPYMLLGLSLLNIGNNKQAEYFLNLILKDSKKQDKGFHCWDGLDMPIQMINTYKKKGAPNVISTELAARFILQYVKKTNKRQEELGLVLRSVEDYFVNTMLVNYNGHKHFKYYDVTPDELFVFNSNANVCAILAEIDNYLDSTKHKSLVNEIVNSIIDHQSDKGVWNYNVNLRTRDQKIQVDFHQGFILDGLLRIMQAYGKSEKIEHAYLRGLEYYRGVQFHDSGRSYYRIPKKYPTNIHNQSQGIITFNQAANFGYGEHYRKFSHKIAAWTVKEMYKKGRFHYLKYPFFSNKIPYMRWNDANMLNAISHLISSH